MHNLLHDTKTYSLGELAISTDQLLESWQNHRMLTRKVIDAFPQLELMTLSIGEQGPFARMAMELIDWVVPTLNGMISGEWETAEETLQDQPIRTKEQLLQLWDDTTDAINILWRQIPARRFQQWETAFDQYEGPLYQMIQRIIDKEIHHRGMAYVYLRVLGVEPPAFIQE